MTGAKYERGPLTERILRVIHRRGMVQRQVALRAGIRPSRFYDRVKADNWSYDEVRAIAAALGTRPSVLLNVTETL